MKLDSCSGVQWLRCVDRTAVSTETSARGQKRKSRLMDCAQSCRSDVTTDACLWLCHRACCSNVARRRVQEVDFQTCPYKANRHNTTRGQPEKRETRVAIEIALIMGESLQGGRERWQASGGGERSQTQRVSVEELAEWLRFFESARPSLHD